MNTDSSKEFENISKLSGSDLVSDYALLAKRYFKFLIDDFKYKLVKDTRESMSHVIEYQGNNRKIRLNFDLRDNFFYFRIYNGLDVKYSDTDRENIKVFPDLIKKFNLPLKLKELQPDKKQFDLALKKNAELLKNYGKDILTGKEWF
ncbi:hypothetical protein LEP1GSC047_0162 [Leptospira inadai serovar Lyme str. 10]|uniref:PF14137 domain protein n=2 Tax=Leptospira inadai serovar Lyme TaxID=293084 RepID=V6HEP8_9LEPT|nr:hypothetical protein [Leptospira inadai]EQA38906.1 hypothetical protein LEP1GSC047_0162 [Leptospira inadai serovar Lyme str. 10]PNV72139.1 hypothetical protein BES34_020150 [Leptospira inadai serovar Lyme]